MPERIRIAVTPSEQVTAIVYPAAPDDPAGVCLILAHGAGANQTSGFMTQIAGALAARGIETITFNFVYSEAGRRLPDRNDKLEACWRSVIAAYRSGTIGGHGERRKLAIGGKSIAFSGDSGWTEELLPFVAGVDLFLCEYPCQCQDGADNKCRPRAGGGGARPIQSTDNRSASARAEDRLGYRPPDLDVFRLRKNAAEDKNKNRHGKYGEPQKH